MRVTIVLPHLLAQPSGGYKVQYEYADGLAARGHFVTIVHPRFCDRTGNLWRYLRTVAKHRLVGNGIVSWFELDKTVKVKIPRKLTARFLPRADVTVLTSWTTAAATMNPPRRAGRLAQVVYDYEFWMSASDETRRQMKKAFRREDVSHIATSNAVAGMLQSMGIHPVAFARAGIDLKTFRCTAAAADRAPRVGFAVRREAVKALPVMLEACELIHRQRPDISFLSYGQDLDSRLPPFLDHRGFLSESALSEFYNECSVFVLPSDYEGWGLPAVEAMACGAALVTTANGGIDDFASDRENALVVPPRRPDAIARAVLRLIEDRKLRLSLIGRALETAQGMSLTTATSNFENTLKGVADRGPSA